MLNAFTNWGLFAVSFFNIILLLWLGLTVLLNAERRPWGTILAGSGLLLGGAFFAVHAATVDLSIDALVEGINPWWFLLSLPIVALPLGWYVLMLWYCGFWNDPQAGLHRRQRFLFLLTLGLAACLLVLLVASYPHLKVRQLSKQYPINAWTFHGVRFLLLLYPVYIVACTALSLDALRRPAPSGRLMGDLARRRARPWLMASSIVQLVAGLLVAATLLWVGADALGRPLYRVYDDNYELLNGANLVIAVLTGGAIVLLGKAVVSYEIFTGKTLPRHGFLRQWRSVVALAMGYSALAAWACLQDWKPVYTVLLPTVLMSGFSALLSWRSYAERERTMASLRPFVSSQHLYEQLVEQDEGEGEGSDNLTTDATIPFQTLCRDVLGARLAYLVALGPLAPLVGPPLCFPAEETAPALGALPEQLSVTPRMCLALEPDNYSGAQWAVPLWSERGLIGVLLLGEKEDGGLYTQEEIEVARGSGERLIDTQASAALSGRLMALQRQRLAESQILDRRARRVLHDDVLPRLHAAMLTLSATETESDPARQDALTQLAKAHSQISGLLREMPSSTSSEVARLGLVEALRRTVEEESGDAFDDVQWNIEPNAVEAIGQVPSLTMEVLFYAAREAIRNAARHGRQNENGAATPLQLKVSVEWRGGLQIVIEDNGIGLSGTNGSSSEAGGSGQGLMLHSTMMAVAGGALSTQSALGQGTRVSLSLPEKSALQTPPQAPLDANRAANALPASTQTI